MKSNKDLINSTRKKYKKSVNMTYTELLIWSKKPISKLASLSREPITRNLRLLKKKADDWTMRDVKGAKKTISYIARAKKIPRGKIIAKGLTKNMIALRNWGYDTFKK